VRAGRAVTSVEVVTSETLEEQCLRALRGPVVSPASYSEGTGFKSRLGDPTILTEVFVVFLLPADS
jgi:hypothetical protein